MDDVAEFLRNHPPFDDLDEQELEQLAGTVEVECFPAGTTIFRQGEEPPSRSRSLAASPNRGVSCSTICTS